MSLPPKIKFEDQRGNLLHWGSYALRIRIRE